MAIKPIQKPYFDLRWRFEYNDGTKPKYGIWTYASDNPKEMASFQKRENLARAIIETKCRRTGEIKTPVHCSGQDFALFKWVAGVRKGFNIQSNETNTLSPDIIGLMLVTRDIQATVYIDGREPKIEPRSEQDKNFNYKGY